MHGLQAVARLLIGRFCKATTVEGQRSWLGSLDMPRFVLRENETFAVDQPWCLKLTFSGPLFFLLRLALSESGRISSWRKNRSRSCPTLCFSSLCRQAGRACLQRYRSSSFFNSRSNCSLVKTSSIDSWWSSLPIQFKHQWARLEPATTWAGWSWWPR